MINRGPCGYTCKLPDTETGIHIVSRCNKGLDLIKIGTKSIQFYNKHISIGSCVIDEQCQNGTCQKTPWSPPWTCGRSLENAKIPEQGI